MLAVEVVALYLVEQVVQEDLVVEVLVAVVVWELLAQ